MKRGLVISGGGAKGAWAGGVIDYLATVEKIKWDVYSGTSTGSLITPLAATNDIQKMKEAYLNINQYSIFSTSPFKSNGKVNVLNAIWRLITGKTSLGVAKNLKKLIKKFFTEEDFIKIQNKTVISTVTNLTKEQTEHKYNTKESYKDFCDWMFASASVPFGFEVIRKNNQDYVDGFILENIPLQVAIDEGCKEIDVIILSTKNGYKNNSKIDNMFDLSTVLINTMINQTEKDDLLMSKHQAEHKDIKLNFYYTNYNLTSNALDFDKNLMESWWREGYYHAKFLNSKNS